MSSRVLIVGAGPAGIRAAETLVDAGLVPVVVDEGARAGGQVYRRPPCDFTRPPNALYGSETTKAVDLHTLFDRMVNTGQVTYRSESSVLGVANGCAQVLGPTGVDYVDYDRLVLATGAMDRSMPVPGWQAAGVYSLGAAQIALKTQGVALGRQIVLAGSGPLLTLVAAQLIEAGAGVAAVLDTAPLSAQVRGGLDMVLARPVVTARGLALRALLGRRYRAGVTLKQIEVDADRPRAVHWCDARGRHDTTACDTVAIGWHLRAETALADLAGVEFKWSSVWKQWLPRTDLEGRGGKGLYLAGDGLCILGADAAEIAGRLAARACLADLGLPVVVKDQARDLRRMARMRRFAEGLARAFPWPTAAISSLADEVVICRCEGITAGALRASVPLASGEINRAKALSRLGMGRCQGRYCQLPGAELIAAQADQPTEKVGRLRSQPPVRPAPINALYQA